jgi:peptide/nickel transport system permease protein
VILAWRLAFALIVLFYAGTYLFPASGKYYRKKVGWYLVTFAIALALNFLLPRMIPGNPVDIMIQEIVSGIQDSSKAAVYKQQYIKSLGLDKGILEQFFLYVSNMLQGDLGVSFTESRPVTEILSSKIPWSVAIMLPSIVVGWVIGNLLGAVTAYKKGLFDKIIFPAALFLSSIPSFILAMMLLLWLGVGLRWFPVLGGYNTLIVDKTSMVYYRSLFEHWTLPFLSQSLINIGGQAIGMRSMSLYELNADYVLYAKLLGIRDKKVTRYVFRNAMLPQVSGLALSLGAMVTGSTLIEIVFGYPGIGLQLMQAIRNIDYPLISGCTLIISVTMLMANFLIDVIYGLIDPRVRSAQVEEG